LYTSENKKKNEEKVKKTKKNM